MKKLILLSTLIIVACLTCVGNGKSSSAQCQSPETVIIEPDTTSIPVDSLGVDWTDAVK